MPDESSNKKPQSAQYLRKHEAILRGAAEQFLQHGFVGTSVDNIAAAAGVSKQTVYTHFGDKETLFTDVVVDITTRFGEPYKEAVAKSRTVTDMAESLGELARGLFGTVLAPGVLRLRRLVISEVERFPELGQEYFDKGPGRGIAVLADLFSDYRESGLLDFDDADKAAAHFTWLVVSVPLNMIMLLGEDARPSPEEAEILIDDAVRIFLAAYASR